MFSWLFLDIILNFVLILNYRASLKDRLGLDIIKFGIELQDDKK